MKKGTVGALELISNAKTMADTLLSKTESSTLRIANGQRKNVVNMCNFSVSCK